MKIVFYLLLLILFILGVSFAILNAYPVTLNYFLGKKLVPLSLLLGVIFAFGVMLGWIATIKLYLKQRLKNRRLQKHLEIVEKELNNLRVIPLKDTH